MKGAIGELVGGVITTGIPGKELDATTRRTLEQLAPSGVILFRRNVESVGQLRALVAALHALPSRPLVSIDHEGEPVMRVGPPFTAFPAAACIGTCGSPDLAFAVGHAMGRELKSVGVDIDFAPVLDVDSNPENPIIGERAFGREPNEVARLGVAFVRGMLAAGVLPCGKHFPGHGDTDRDSHLELPVVRRSLAELAELELVPFRAAVEAGVPMLMTAHVLYPALDEHRPATLSRPILGHLLRDELGFRGVVVSDDLAMGAIRAEADVADAAVEALAAGVDWLLVCNDIEASLATAERVQRAVAGGELATETLLSARDRIRALHRPSAREAPAQLPIAEHADLDRRIRALSRPERPRG